MTVAAELKTLLDKSKIHYQVLQHEEVYTSLETAEKQDVPGQEFAKSVVIKADDKFGLAVVPSIYRVNLHKLAQGIGARQADLANESEFTKLFPNCDLGAMPPFGQLYQMPVWVDVTLTKDKEIVFNAGSHTEAIKLSFADFKRLVKPQILDFGDRI